jgi:glycosyltransferase involved in cell wall biosynthesis
MNQCVCNHETGTNADGRKFCIGCGKYVESCRCRPIPEKVSIIIPVYNAEDYINEAIKNVLRQTYSNIEIIVVDDGSTDKTLVNLLRDPLAKNIKIIEKENGGVSSALNAGINAMTSNWFKWLSADDVMETNCIEVMMDKIKETPDKYNKIFYTSYDIIDKVGNKLDIFTEPNHNDRGAIMKCALLLNNYYGNATTCMIHKSVFDRVGKFDESLKNGDDYDFWLRALFGYKIELHLIQENLASYRQHPNQLTHRRGAELFKTIKQIREKNLLLLDEEIRTVVLEVARTINRQPLKVKLRKKTRDILFSILPNKINNKILSSYQQRKS